MVYEEWFLSAEGAFGKGGGEDGTYAGVIFLGGIH